jgi:hypothetical protein
VKNSELVNTSWLVRLLVMRSRLAGPKTRLANAPRAEERSGPLEGFGRNLRSRAIQEHACD